MLWICPLLPSHTCWPLLKIDLRDEYCQPLRLSRCVPWQLVPVDQHNRSSTGIGQAMNGWINKSTSAHDFSSSSLCVVSAIVCVSVLVFVCTCLSVCLSVSACMLACLRVMSGMNVWTGGRTGVYVYMRPIECLRVCIDGAVSGRVGCCHGGRPNRICRREDG